MKNAKFLMLLLTLLCCWSGMEVLGQCPNTYTISTNTQPTCDLAANGALTVTGTTHYGNSSTFLWSTGATTRTATSLPPGNYSVTVTDPTGCVYNVASYYLAASNTNFHAPPQYNACRNNISAHSSFDSYGVLWSTGATTRVIDNLVPGLYSLTLTDNYGCQSVQQVNVPVNATPALSVTHTSTAPTSCNGSDGTVDLTVSGGTPPYTFWWNHPSQSNTSTLEDPTNLEAGAAQVQIRDNAGCWFNYNLTVAGAFLSLPNTRTSCGQNNATLSPIVQGFNNPSFLWSTGATTSTISNLSSGTYSVTVSENGCTLVDSTYVGSRGNISTYLSDSVARCDEVYVVAQAFGGYTTTWPPNYSYLWNTGDTGAVVAAQPNITDYIVTVTDINGCTAVDTISNIQSYVGITTSAVITDATCGNSDGAIDLTIAGGSYQQLFWSPTGDTTEDINNISAGFHKVTLTNTLGCTYTDSFAVGEFVIASSTDASCGLNNGSASIVSYNMSNPSYNWSNGATTPTINNLAAGTYTVTVTNNGCVITENIIINDAGTVAVNIQAQGTCQPDYLSATATNGVLPYTYLWSDGSTVRNLANPTVGIPYGVTVTDANGCAVAATPYTISNYPPVVATATTVDASCGNKNGSATIQVTSGAAPYTYQWSTGQGNVATQPTLYAGMYAATVTDNNGCTVVVPNIVVGGQSSIQITAQLTHPSTGLNNGAIDLTITGAATPPVITWSNGAMTEDITGLSSGYYSFSFTDLTTGCTISRQYYLRTPYTGGTGSSSGSSGANITVISGKIFDVSSTNICQPVNYGSVINNTILPYQQVILQPTGQVTFTDIRGYYEFVVSAPGNYTVEYINANPTTNLLCPATPIIAVNNVVLGNNRRGQNFYVTRPPIEDVRINLLSNSNATPGFVYRTIINYYNNSNVVQNGTIEYDYDGFLNLLYAPGGSGIRMTLHDIPNSRFEWTYSNLLPGERRSMYVNFEVPVGTALGTNVTGTASITPLTTDVNPTDNTDIEQTVVVGSYDPNDKQVGIYRTGNAWDGGSIYQTDTTLDYTIRFQNTGTAPAQLVVVRDTLDAHLIPTSIRDISSKHDMNVTLEDGNVLVFTFNNINLPDSSLSQEQSMGYINFTIDRVAGLPVGTQISNQAAIYFDFNAPIFTNTPISVIDQYTTLVELSNTTFEVEAQPNPFERDLLVRYELEQATAVQVKLFNQLGQCVYQQNYAQQDKGPQQVFLQLGDLPAGLYILQVEQEGQTSSKKLIKR